MNEDEVVKLMESSKSAQEWNDNCTKVKKACGGYPDFWYAKVIQAGVAATSQILNGWSER